MLSLSSLVNISGLIFLAHLGYLLYTFLTVFLLHESIIQLYRHEGENSFALVTGASDGLGLALAREALKRGFNVVIHGRNPGKLDDVQKMLKREFASRTVISVIAPADEPERAVEEVVDAVKKVEEKGGKLTVLVNNVGGVPNSTLTNRAFNRFSDISATDIIRITHVNSTFPATLTNALLPRLTANEPSLIMNVGSVAALFGSPYVATYAANKAFNLILSRSLAKEMRLFNPLVEVLGLVVGEVSTNNNKANASFSVLTAQQAAEAAFDRVGCGYEVIPIHWRHGMIGAIVTRLPDGLVAKFLAQAVGDKARTEARQA